MQRHPVQSRVADSRRDLRHAQDYAGARPYFALQDCLYLGNLDARRDWGDARDDVEAMWLMLQQPTAEDFVIASGVQKAVWEFIDRAADELGCSLAWEGQGAEEVGRVASTGGARLEPGQVTVRVDPRYFRPTEVDILLGDATKAKSKLGWIPRTGFGDLVAEMVREDLRTAERDELVKSHGHAVFNHID